MKLFDLSVFNDVSYQTIHLYSNCIYKGNVYHCHDCIIMLHDEILVETETTRKITKIKQSVINKFNNISLSNYNNKIRLFYTYNPCKWFDNSCAMDSVLLFLCILNDNIHIYEKIKCEPEDKLKIYEIFKYIHGKNTWDKVQNYRDEILNKIVDEYNLKSRFCDVQDILNWLFKTDDVEIPINEYKIINGSMSESKLNAFKDLCIIYNYSHYAVLYEGCIYDSIYPSLMTNTSFAKLIYVSKND